MNKLIGTYLFKTYPYPQPHCLKLLDSDSYLGLLKTQANPKHSIRFDVYKVGINSDPDKSAITNLPHLSV